MTRIEPDSVSYEPITQTVWPQGYFFQPRIIYSLVLMLYFMKVFIIQFDTDQKNVGHDRLNLYQMFMCLRVSSLCGSDKCQVLAQCSAQHRIQCVCVCVCTVNGHLQHTVNFTLCSPESASFFGFSTLVFHFCFLQKMLCFFH